MEQKSVLICEYCGEVINQKDVFVHDIEREFDRILHEGFYHQECFVNSIIKDLERLDFKVIRPRSKFHKDQDPEPVGELPNICSTMIAPLMNAMGDLSDLQDLKEKALDQIKTQTQNGVKKGEKKQKKVGTRKSK